MAAIARAVVGQDPLDPDPDLGVLADGQLDRPRGALGTLVGDRDDDGVAAGVVDEHLEMLVADLGVAAVSVPTAAQHAPAAAVGHPTEQLVVLVNERTRVTGDVPNRRSGHPIGVMESVEAGPPEDAVDRRARMAGERRQAGRTIPSAGAGPEDRRRHLVGRAAWRAMGSGTAVLEAGQAGGPIAADPLVRRRPADPKLLGDRRRRPAVDHHPFHQELPTENAETRSRMCHESLRPVWVFDTSHRAARLSFVNNVLKHHT
jgi:hypothetical protein